MSFTIKLQRNNSDKRKIGKSVTDVLSVTGTLREDTSIIDPVIMIECNLADVKNVNYCTIGTFGRKYFVNNIRSIRNGLVEFTCHVDVLDSFKSDILSNTGVIRRQEKKWNLYLQDAAFKIQQNPMVLAKNFPTGFPSPEFVLAVAGR